LIDKMICETGKLIF